MKYVTQYASVASRSTKLNGQRVDERDRNCDKLKIINAKQGGYLAVSAFEAKLSVPVSRVSLRIPVLLLHTQSRLIISQALGCHSFYFSTLSITGMGRMVG